MDNKFIYYAEKRTKGEFIKNLKKGNVYEDKAIEILIKEYNLKLINKNNDYKYDFKMSNNKLYEVKHKYDLFKNDYVNIEYARLNKQNEIIKTGISTTKADYYIITDGTKYILIDINNLINLTFKSNNLQKTDKQVYNAINYVVLLKDLETNAEKVFNVKDYRENILFLD